MIDHVDYGQSLNRAIDEVAARMTAGDAPDDLRMRVLRRIRERRQPVWLWTLKPAAALAILALATVAVQVIRTSRSIDTRQPPAVHVGTAATTTASTTSAGNAAADLDRVSSRPVRTAPKPTPPRISAAEAAWRERAIPALAPIESLSIGSIQPEALSVPQLEVKPLASAPANVVSSDGKGVR